MTLREFIESIIEGLRDTSPITLITDNGNGTFTITTDPLNLSVDNGIGDYVTISGISYQISNLTAGSFDITSSVAVIGSTWTANAPYYFHGTPIAVNEQLRKIQIGKQKASMIYLAEILRERINNDPLSRIASEQDIALFFMDNANFPDWTTTQHYTNVITPMRALVTEFITALKASPRVGEFEEYDLINHAKWGLYIDNKGHKKNIFDENLSGVEMQINLPLTWFPDCWTN